MPEAFLAIVLIAILLLACEIVRQRVQILKDLFIPSSIIAGALALLLGPQLLGWIVGLVDDELLLAQGLFPAAVIEAWSALPGLLINVVFAGLFLGHPLPSLRTIWYRAGPQVVFGQAVAWGQYVVGLLLAILVLAPLFGTNPMAGALIEIGFEGGHGTAAGMEDTFRELGFEEGADLALGLATIGLLMGVVLGTVLINWAARQGHIATTAEDRPAGGLGAERPVTVGKGDLDDLEKLKRMERSPTDPLSLHLGIVALAIAIGWLLHHGLIWLETVTWQLAGGPELMRHMPLFPLAMIGGVMIQVVIDRCGWQKYISRRMVMRISGSALDVTIVAALATLSLAAIGAHFVPFVLLALAGILWCIFAVLVIAPRVIPYNWFERGIGDFGQSMGVTVTGLLLMRMADPQNRSGALESFGYKQLLFEPIVGGGLFTAASIPLIAQFGPVTVLVLCAVIMAAWLTFGFLYFGPLVKQERAKRPK